MTTSHPERDAASRPHVDIVDGNALVGILDDVFGRAASGLALTCGGCGSIAPLPKVLVELAPASAIVRCRSCTRTTMTVRWTATQVVIDAGPGELTVPRPTA